MKEVSHEFVTNLNENLFKGYGKQSNLGFNPAENEKQSRELASATQGKFTAAPAAGNAQEPKVTGNQENAAAASNAGPHNDTFSHEAVKDPGTSPAANIGLPSDIANRWSMPKTLSDSQMVTTPETSLHENPLQERIDRLEEAITTIVAALKKQLNEAKAPSTGLSKKKKKATVKKAKARKDIGKKGKNFGKVAAKATKKYGSAKAGEKVAAAAMWKNLKK